MNCSLPIKQRKFLGCLPTESVRCVAIIRATLLFLAANASSISVLGEERDDLSLLQDIFKLLNNRQQVIQTASLEYDSTVIIGKKGLKTLSHGVEKYKRNRSLNEVLEYEGMDFSSAIITKFYGRYWDGKSSYKASRDSNADPEFVTIGNMKERAIVPYRPIFLRASLVQPCHCFAIEYADPLLRMIQGDVWFLRVDKNTSAPGPRYSKESFKNGICEFKKIKDDILQFTDYNFITKAPHQIVEFNTKANYFPVRIVTFITHQEGSTLPLYSEIVASDLRELVPGNYFAHQFTEACYADKTPNSVISKEEVKIIKFEINGKIDDAEFTPKFPAGTKVIDKQKGIEYTVEEDQKRGGNEIIDGR